MKDVVFIGAGLAKLALAVALHQRGVRVWVFPEDSHPSHHGMGWVLPPYAMAVLNQLGLADEVLRHGNPLSRIGADDPRGNLLSQLELSRLGKRPTVAIHHAALEHLLRRALPSDSVIEGQAYTSHHTTADKVEIHFADGEHASADLLVGGTGRHSRLRTARLRPLPKPAADTHCWYGVSHRPVYRRLGHPTDSFFESWGTGQRFGYVDLNDQETYWYAICHGPQPGIPSSPAQLVSLFAGWHAPVAGLVHSTPEDAIAHTPLLPATPTTTQFYDERLALLHDETQPTTPDLLQGAGAAFESAHELARALQPHRPLAECLNSYSQRRTIRMEHLARVQFGVDQLVNLNHPLACAMRNMAMRMLPSRLLKHPIARFLDVLHEPAADPSLAG